MVQSHFKGTVTWHYNFLEIPEPLSILGCSKQGWDNPGLVRNLNSDIKKA